MTTDTILERHEQGRTIVAVVFSDGDSYYAVGQYGVVSLTPVPVAGQGAWVYWIEVVINHPESNNRKPANILVNPTHLESIEYEAEGWEG